MKVGEDIRIRCVDNGYTVYRNEYEYLDKTMPRRLCVARDERELFQVLREVFDFVPASAAPAPAAHSDQPAQKAR